MSCYYELESRKQPAISPGTHSQPFQSLKKLSLRVTSFSLNSSNCKLQGGSKKKKNLADKSIDLSFCYVLIICVLLNLETKTLCSFFCLDFFPKNNDYK